MKSRPTSIRISPEAQSILDSKGLTPQKFFDKCASYECELLNLYKELYEMAGKTAMDYRDGELSLEECERHLDQIKTLLLEIQRMNAPQNAVLR